MPTVEEDLNEGFKLDEQNGVLHLSRTFFCKDLAGANPTQVFSSALLLTAVADGGAAHTGADVPGEFETITVNGKTLYVQSRGLTPWPPADATVNVKYSESPRLFTAAGFGPTIWETGSTVEQVMTDFDYAGMQLPLGSRTPISVNYTPAGGSAMGAQTHSVPYFAGKSTLVATREQTANPDTLADRFIGKRNLTAWRGYLPKTVLCFGIVGRNPGNTGKWVVTFNFVRDPKGNFNQLLRWRWKTTGEFPSLTTADLAANNGIKLIEVQGDDEFADLGLS